LKNICILGATGSIGQQTLDVIRSDKNNYKLTAISANVSFERVIYIINEFLPSYVAIMDDKAYEKVKNYCDIKYPDIKVFSGIDGLNMISTLPEVDLVVTSVVGIIGLVPTLNAIKSGKTIALANKETLVVGGELVKKAAKDNNVHILPVDSEHGAIFQCLQGNKLKEVEKILLTASGGPFRGKKSDELLQVSSTEALKHPKWNMGRKISIDSATLMNKGLEVIEAHWLFDIDYSKIDVLVHPQSVIHSMVEYIDGSILAQLGPTDMRMPIQYAMNYPHRLRSTFPKLDFTMISSLTFEQPDLETFRCLKLAYEAGKSSGLMPTILNGANEVAVELFLQDKVKFLQIADIIEECMNTFSNNSRITLEDILETDTKVRKYVFDRYGKGGI
jgi:1-deoxy-D-xylulose-5-phosphate reductoisomerase